MKIDLNGAWKLGFTHPESKEYITLEASVPGNAELDLYKKGIIGNPMPVDEIAPYEELCDVDDWTYTTTFDARKAEKDEDVFLKFEGIDTIADVYLNGEKIYEADNMHLIHSIDVNGKLKEKDNELKVIIHSAMLWARKHPTDIVGTARSITYYGGSPYLRKARHQWGWDNAPRLLTSGIFRPVYIEYLPKERFEDVYLYTICVTDGGANIGVVWDYKLPEETSCKGYVLRYTVSQDGNVLASGGIKMFYPSGKKHIWLSAEKLKLWWPRNLGDPNLCDIKLEVFKDEVLKNVWESKFGVRTVKLINTGDILDDGTGEFKFVVNGKDAYIHGTNWKPLDAFHSQAEDRVERALGLVDDLNCNMIRIWGGGIYEGKAFFDYCDKNGIMVWQDFMFACEFPPLDDWFMQKVEIEAKQIIKRLRNHPSLAVWSGDNEDDYCVDWNFTRHSNMRPSHNRLTREVIKKCVLYNDPFRDYVESSPYQSDENFVEQRDGKVIHHSTEEHFYKKPDVYAERLRNLKSKFLCETGPILICASTENEHIWDIEKPRAKRLWDDLSDRNPIAHQYDSYFRMWRYVGKLTCEDWFGRDFSFDEFGDYNFAVNVICSNIFKDIIEYCRASRPEKTGVIWWSLLDMWPMLFNYSVVDYDFHKKHCYSWIKQSQQFFCLMAVRKGIDGEIGIYASNDTLKTHSGSYKIIAVDKKGNKKEIASGRFSQKENSVSLIQKLPEAAEPELWIIEWEEDNKTYYNHFTPNYKTGDIDIWKIWQKELDRIYK